MRDDITARVIPCGLDCGDDEPEALGRRRATARAQPPPPANQAARSIGECGSSRGAAGGGFVAVPVTLIGARPMRTTVHSPSREVAIQLASGSDACLRLASAIASSRVIRFRMSTPFVRLPPTFAMSRRRAAFVSSIATGTRFEPSSLGTRPVTGAHGVVFDTQSHSSVAPLDPQAVTQLMMAIPTLRGSPDWLSSPGYCSDLLSPGSRDPSRLLQGRGHDQIYAERRSSHARMARCGGWRALADEFEVELNRA